MARASHGGSSAEAGFGLLEMLVAMLIMGVVLAMVGPVYSAIEGSEQLTQSVNVADDQVRPVLLQMVAEVGSASVLYDPATEGTNAGASVPAGFSVRMLTQAYGRLACVQWRVVDAGDAGGVLEERSWPPGWQSGDAVPAWDIEATTIVNPASDPPFTLSASTTYDADMLDIHLEVGNGYGGSSHSSASPLLDLSTSVSTGNSPGDPASCSVVPPAGVVS